MHDYSGFKETIGHNSKIALTRLADSMMAHQAKIAKLEAELEQQKTELKDISENQIPRIFDNLSGSLTLDDGRKIEVKPIIRAGIKKDGEKAAEAYKFLEECGSGDLIKNIIVIEFPKEKAKDADALFEYLVKQRYNVKRDRAVHWQTLTSWVKLKLKAGVDLPFDLLGIFQGKETKIKSPF